MSKAHVKIMDRGGDRGESSGRCSKGSFTSSSDCGATDISSTGAFPNLSRTSLPLAPCFNGARGQRGSDKREGLFFAVRFPQSPSSRPQRRSLSGSGERLRRKTTDAFDECEDHEKPERTLADGGELSDALADRRDDPVHQAKLPGGRCPAAHLPSASEYDGAGGLLHDGLSGLENKTARLDETSAESGQTAVRNPGVSLLCPGRRDQGTSVRPKMGLPGPQFIPPTPIGPTMAPQSRKF